MLPDAPGRDGTTSQGVRREPDLSNPIAPTISSNEPIIQACEALIPRDIEDSDFSMFKDRLETILDVRAQWPSLSVR